VNILPSSIERSGRLIKSIFLPQTKAITSATAPSCSIWRSCG